MEISLTWKATAILIGRSIEPDEEGTMARSIDPQSGEVILSFRSRLELRDIERGTS